LYIKKKGVPVSVDPTAPFKMYLLGLVPFVCHLPFKNHYVGYMRSNIPILMHMLGQYGNILKKEIKKFSLFILKNKIQSFGCNTSKEKNN